MSTIQAQAALGKGGPLEAFSYEPQELGPHDIEIDISHCGLCHSDIHLIDDGWGRSKFPQVPATRSSGQGGGARASAVTHLTLGQRVGVGWQRSACLECDLCLGGEENLCRKQQATCMGHHGGLADRIRLDGRFAFALPAELDSAVAAPLLCGGVTVFSPMRRFGIGATSSVAVIGIGGLGHMALLMLRALGAETTAFSTSPDKKRRGAGHGGPRFLRSTDRRTPQTLRPVRSGPVDVARPPRLDHLSANVAGQRKLCLLGIRRESFSSRPRCSSPASARSPEATSAAASSSARCWLRHPPPRRPQIQHMPMAEANAGLTRLRQNQVRYRLVLER